MDKAKTNRYPAAQHRNYSGEVHLFAAPTPTEFSATFLQTKDKSVHNPANFHKVRQYWYTLA